MFCGDGCHKDLGEERWRWLGEVREAGEEKKKKVPFLTVCNPQAVRSSCFQQILVQSI